MLPEPSARRWIPSSGAESTLAAAFRWGATGAFLVGLVACEATPRDSHVQWVARDAWDSSCADKAIVERWVQSGGHWQEQGKVWVVDVDATFKLGNDCQSSTAALAFSAYQSVTFQRQGLAMTPCTRDGEAGWALLGQEQDRCWTGPSLTAAP